MDPQIFLLVIIGTIGTISIVGFKWYWQYKLKVDKIIVREQAENAKPENQINELLDHIPQILKDRRDLYEQSLRQSGADAPMTKSLKQQVDILSMVESVPTPVLNMLKPMALGAIKMVSRFIPK